MYMYWKNNNLLIQWHYTCISHFNMYCICSWFICYVAIYYLVFCLSLFASWIWEKFFANWFILKSFHSHTHFSHSHMNGSKLVSGRDGIAPGTGFVIVLQNMGCDTKRLVWVGETMPTPHQWSTSSIKKSTYRNHSPAVATMHMPTFCRNHRRYVRFLKNGKS